MSPKQWQEYLDDVVVNVTSARGTSFEWNEIKKRVKAKDGDVDHGPQIHRHYVPYLAIRDSLDTEVLGYSREGACRVLLKQVIKLYTNSIVFPIKDLQPPPYNRAVEDSLQDTLKLQTRAAMTSWINWALEAICDYPDNIFYGPGTGDGAGTKVDEPHGSKGGVQLPRVRGGAKLLREVVGGRIMDLVDENGKKL